MLHRPFQMNPCHGSITPTTVGRKSIVHVNFDVIVKNYKSRLDPKIENFESQVLNITEEIDRQKIDFVARAKELSVANLELDDSTNTLESTTKLHNEIKGNIEERKKLENEISNLKNLKDTISNICTSSNDTIISTVFYQELIDGKGKDEADSNKPSIIHYTINDDEVKDFVGTKLARDELHPIEESLFTQALVELQHVESFENFYKSGTDVYPNNALLVDIFVRSEGIIRGSSDFAETHTIVLWKGSNSRITLIDPSHSKFSIGLKDSIQNLSVNSIEKKEIHVIDGVIYSSNGQITGSTEFSARDCIDLAVKIGFELKEQQKEAKFACSEDMRNNTCSNAIRQVSNQVQFAPHMRYVRNILVRTLQSSRHVIRVAALHTLQTALHDEKKTSLKRSNLT